MTDVFRLLTRSTTLKKRPFESAIPAAPQPAPAVSKPNKKRKKTKTENATTSTEESSLALPRELDFFGLGTSVTAEAGPISKKRNDGEPEESGDEEAQSSDDEDETNGGVELPPTPEEIKAILHKHKLKFNLLNPIETPEPAATEPPKKKKSKSKSKHEKPEPKKKQKKPELLVPPLTSFEQLRTQYKLSKRVYANILAQGYLEPTEVQMAALPVFMNKNLDLEGVPKDAPIDLLTCAPTGSGKTLAYVVPVLNQLLAEKKDETKKGVKAVILAPTKELVSQIVYEVKKLANGTALRVSQMKKGSLPLAAEADELPEDYKEPTIKSDILVSTPLVLQHALEKAPIKNALAGVKHLVLDEADVLLDKLFRDQTLGVWRHLRSGNAALRASLWSATISAGTEELAITELTPEPESSAPRPSILRLIVGIKDTSLPTISQKLIYTATESGKLLALRQLFTSALRPPILIFLQSIQRAQALYNEILYDLPTPGRIAVLHAELTDSKREEIMRNYRLGEIWVLITTDLLSRGIDFHGVQMVVNYDIPTSVASYIHRVGRTGRAGRAGGEAVTYYTKEDIGYVKGIATVIDKGTEGGLEDWVLKALPKTGKREKERLKERGVEARRGGQKVAAKERISTKSGWQRKKEMQRKEMVEASKKRKEADMAGNQGESDDDE